tara:strand:- start:101 stop:406 length:306 start_codon:yes stop_codon:yes gene_type:complete
MRFLASFQTVFPSTIAQDRLHNFAVQNPQTDHRLLHRTEVINKERILLVFARIFAFYSCPFRSGGRNSYQPHGNDLLPQETPFPLNPDYAVVSRRNRFSIA